MKPLILICSLIIGTIHAPIITAQEGPNKRPSFDTLDSNGDGEVSRDEVTNEKLLHDFYLYDRDISGTLTLEEFPKGPQGDMNQGMGQPQGKPPSFAEFDINGDGELTKDELKGPLARDFERLDLDKSNSLTLDELPKPPSMG